MPNGLPKDDQEFIKGQQFPEPEGNGLPEAPASATLSVVTPKGYNALFTLREMNGQALLKKITGLEFQLEELGYKPQVKGFPKKEIEYVEGKVCPIDGGRLKVIISKKDGETYWTCENGKYDYMTKTTTGCKFICSPENYEQRVKQVKAENEENFDEPY